MFFRRIIVYFLRLFLIMFLLYPAFAQMERIYQFKGVKIPYNLKYHDSIIKKGKYDLEFLKHSAQTVFYLKIKKKGETICLVPGERLSYGPFANKEIPAKPRMKMKRNLEEKIVYIIFESGTITWKYPAIKVRFKIEYEE